MGYPDIDSQKTDEQRSGYRTVGGLNLDVPDDFKITQVGANVQIESLSNYSSRKFMELKDNMQTVESKFDQRLKALEEKIDARMEAMELEIAANKSAGTDPDPVLAASDESAQAEEPEQVAEPEQVKYSEQVAAPEQVAEPEQVKYSERVEELEGT